MKTAEEILKEQGINDDSFFTYGGAGFECVGLDPQKKYLIIKKKP